MADLKACQILMLIGAIIQKHDDYSADVVADKTECFRSNCSWWEAVRGVHHCPVAAYARRIKNSDVPQ